LLESLSEIWRAVTAHLVRIMKMIHEMRQQRAWEAHRNTSPLPIILGAVIAFGIGLLGVSGMVRAPNLFPAKTQMVPVVPLDAAKPATVTIDTSSRGVGRAEAAPLLKTCVPFSKLGFERDVGASDIYRVLQSASGMSRVAALAGIKQKAIDDAQFAAIWAEVADCVYRQNGWMLCDPDNRAFAAEAANAFVRQLAIAVKAEKFVDGGEPRPLGRGGDQRAHALQNAEAIKGRVLAGVHVQVADGRLTASDFGMFAAPELAQVVRDTKVTRDACAAR
jgi:hypothetical protein